MPTDPTPRFVRLVGTVTGSIVVPDFRASHRFYKVRRHLAYACWRLNAIERWISSAATQFRLRDRITQQTYDLVTDETLLTWAPTVPWYSSANLDALLDLIEDQFRTGGPSGKGAHRFWAHELIEQLRPVAANVNAALWRDPPDGIGFGGAMFGAHWTTLLPTGQRVAWGGIAVQPIVGSLGGAGKFPLTPDSPTVDPTGSDSVSWDYASGTAPPHATHYLPIDHLLPDPITTPDVIRGWNRDATQDYFTQLGRVGAGGPRPHLMGTTSNANDWPPDYQILSEFNLDHGTLPLAGHKTFNTGAAAKPHNGPEEDSYPASTLTLAPPDGTGTNPAMDLWSANRATARRRVQFQSCTEWSKFQPEASAICQTIPSLNPPPGANIIRNRERHLLRIGFENDVQGKPWKLSYFDWLANRLGAVPLEIHLVGTVTATATLVNVGTLFNNVSGVPASSETVRVECGMIKLPNDEAAVRAMLGTPAFDVSLAVHTFTLSVAMSSADPDSQTVSSMFDVDVSAYFRSVHFDSDALFIGVVGDPADPRFWTYLWEAWTFPTSSFRMHWRGTALSWSAALSGATFQIIWPTGPRTNLPIG